MNKMEGRKRKRKKNEIRKKKKMYDNLLFKSSLNLRFKKTCHNKECHK